MGTVTFDVTRVGRTASVRGKLVESGAHTTTTTASDLTNGAAGAGSAIDLTVGDILTIKGDEDMRLKFGGETATATSGLILYANEPDNFECTGKGAVSIIDVA